MEYNTKVILPNEKVIVKIDSCKKLLIEWIMGNKKKYNSCHRRLQLSKEEDKDQESIQPRPPDPGHHMGK